MPPNFREFLKSSAFAARTNKVDRNDRALLKFDMKLAHFFRMLIEKYFLYWLTLEPSSRITMGNLQKCVTRNRWRLPPASKRIFELL
jgi:hypothetical protein